MCCASYTSGESYQMNTIWWPSLNSSIGFKAAISNNRSIFYM